MHVNVRAVSGAAALMLAAGVSLQAHHSLTAEYDPAAPLTLKGRITKVELTNPHSFIELDAAMPDGKVESWRVEAGSPATLVKREITREMLAVGTVVTINGFHAKNGSRRAWGAEMTFADGRTIKLGDEMTQVVSDEDLRPPTFVENILLTLPFLPYLVAALPAVVLLVGLYIRRRPAR